jgi:hypothetical protein
VNAEYEWETSPYDPSQDQLVETPILPNGNWCASRRVGFVTWKLTLQRYEARTYSPREVQVFTSKKDAKAWVLAMVRLTN